MSSVRTPGLIERAADATAAEIDAALRAFEGSAGWMVRCTPRRWVVRCEIDAGLLFCKLRDGNWRDARREWDWLSGRGPPLPLPDPVALCRRGNRSLVALREAPGRPLQALLAEAEPAPLRACVVGRIAPWVARLHAAGWVYRDLYWNHVFARSLDGDPVWIDVERAFMPRVRFRRWAEKDVAGLVSSAQPALPDALVDDALRAYRDAGGVPIDAAAVRARAARVRARRPRYG